MQQCTNFFRPDFISFIISFIFLINICVSLRSIRIAFVWNDARAKSRLLCVTLIMAQCVRSFVFVSMFCAKFFFQCSEWTNRWTFYTYCTLSVRSVGNRKMHNLKKCFPLTPDISGPNVTPVKRYSLVYWDFI